MRKVIMFNLVSLDGYYEGPDHDIGWHGVDEEFNQLSIDQLRTFGTILFGRVTYEMMASYGRARLHWLKTLSLPT